MWACVDVRLSKKPEFKKFHSLTQHDECLSILYVHDLAGGAPWFFSVNLQRTDALLAIYFPRDHVTEIAYFHVDDIRN